MTCLYKNQIISKMVLVLLTFVISFCNSRSSNKSLKSEESKVSTLGQLDTSMKNHFSKLREYLKFDPVINSGEEQIRIWLEQGYSDSGKVVLFKKEDTIWSSQIFYYKSYADKDGELMRVEARSQASRPKLGWKYFINVLDDRGLYKLRNYTEIPGYSLSTGGDAVIVEIQNAESYKISAYPNFKYYLGKVSDVDGINNILHIIEGQFNFRIL